jgi:hypothetical protein
VGNEPSQASTSPHRQAHAAHASTCHTCKHMQPTQASACPHRQPAQVITCPHRQAPARTGKSHRQAPTSPFCRLCRQHHSLCYVHRVARRQSVCTIPLVHGLVFGCVGACLGAQVLAWVRRCLLDVDIMNRCKRRQQKQTGSVNKKSHLHRPLLAAPPPQ